MVASLPRLIAVLLTAAAVPACQLQDKKSETHAADTTAAEAVTATDATAAAKAPVAIPVAGEGTVSPRGQATLKWKRKCAVCHGEQGAGDGPGAKALEPKPANFQDPKWQASVTDQHLRKAIVGGGKAVGKSGSMPAYPDLGKQPKLLAELVKRIRSFEKK